MMKRLVKGSKAAKDFMAKIRAKKGAVKKTVKRVVKNAKQSFQDGYNSKNKVGATYYFGDGKVVFAGELKIGQTYEWIAGAEYLEVVYIGKKSDNPNIKTGSSVGINPNYLFQFNDGRKMYVALSSTALREYIRTIPKKVGSTLLINKGENPRKKPTRVIQVDRTKKGTFKKFKQISGVSKKHTDTKSHNINIKVGALPSYKDPEAAREIQLYADNDSQLYYQRRKPILINLSKKHKKGQYDIDKAAKLWRYYIDAAMQKYQKEFGGRGSWSSLLSVADRKVLANDYALNTLEEFELGNYTEK